MLSKRGDLLFSYLIIIYTFIIETSVNVDICSLNILCVSRPYVLTHSRILSTINVYLFYFIGNRFVCVYHSV